MINPDHKNTLSTRNLQQRVKCLPLSLEGITVLCIIQAMLTDVPKLDRND